MLVFVAHALYRAAVVVYEYNDECSQVKLLYGTLVGVVWAEPVTELK